MPGQFGFELLEPGAVVDGVVDGVVVVEGMSFVDDGVDVVGVVAALPVLAA